MIPAVPLTCQCPFDELPVVVDPPGKQSQVHDRAVPRRRKVDDRPGCAFWLGISGLCAGSGPVVLLVELGLDPAFAVPFLPAHNLPHHGSFASLVQRLRALPWLLAGAAVRRLSSLTHGQILLQDGMPGSARSQGHCHASPPAPVQVAHAQHPAFTATSAELFLDPWRGAEGDADAVWGVRPASHRQAGEPLPLRPKRSPVLLAQPAAQLTRVRLSILTCQTHPRRQVRMGLGSAPLGLAGG